MVEPQEALFYSDLITAKNKMVYIKGVAKKHGVSNFITSAYVK